MGTGKEDGSVFGLVSAGPRGRNGIPEQPSCKYPASIDCGDVKRTSDIRSFGFQLGILLEFHQLETR